MSDALTIFRAAIAAVDPGRCVAEALRVQHDGLSVGGHHVPIRPGGRVHVAGAGKATAAMALGLEQTLGQRWVLSGSVNVPDPCVPDPCVLGDLGQVHVRGVRPGGINEPTAAAIEGTRRMRAEIAALATDDVLVVLISGGGSALLCDPRPPMTLADKLAVTRHLAAAGVDIEQINAVRRALSDVKAGGLIAGCRATTVTLVLSDVLGDPVESIASGPTIAPPGGWDQLLAQAQEVLSRTDPHRRLPSSIYQVLAQRRRQMPRPAGHVAVVGNNAVAVDAAGVAAESLGYNHVMHCPAGPQPTAQQAGVDHAERLLGLLRRDAEHHRVDALITGGEPTVELCEASIRGTGGRNQHLVLAAYQRLLAESLSPDDWQRLTLLSGGTDGEDGPTDAAGAVIDAAVHRRAQEAGLDVAEALRRNDAHTFFDRCGGLIRTGATGTNVCDVRVGLVTDVVLPSRARLGESCNGIIPCDLLSKIHDAGRRKSIPSF